MCGNIVRLNFSLVDISEYIFSDILFLHAILSLLMLILRSAESRRPWNLVNISFLAEPSGLTAHSSVFSKEKNSGFMEEKILCTIKVPRLRKRGEPMVVRL